jgi:hypothetical protein
MIQRFSFIKFEQRRHKNLREPPNYIRSYNLFTHATRWIQFVHCLMQPRTPLGRDVARVCK